MSVDYTSLTEVLKKIERKRYLKLFLEILKCIEYHSITPKEVQDVLLRDINPDRIIEKSDSLLSDLYYSLLHYSLKEENITANELLYFYECINGTRVHAFEDKMCFLKENIKP